jgi:hypothetical protein
VYVTTSPGEAVLVLGVFVIVNAGAAVTQTETDAGVTPVIVAVLVTL